MCVEHRTIADIAIELRMPLASAIASERALNAVRNPACARSQRRYSGAIETYRKMMEDAGIDLESFDSSQPRAEENHPVQNALTYIMLRCGPKSEGFEGLSAHSKEGAIKSAVFNYWRSQGVMDDYVDLGMCTYRGKSWTCTRTSNPCQGTSKGPERV